MVKIAIIIYSTYGHILTLAKAEKKGAEAAGLQADIFQIPETLPQEVLTAIHAPPKPTEIPIVSTDTLLTYDAFLFGIPTRFGTFPAQFKSFWDGTGAQWADGSLHGKPFGVFVSTGTPNGGQETTVRNTLSSFVHHGMIYIPLGYKNAFPLLTSFDEVHGGSPWGAGVYAGADGSRQPNKTELEIGEVQGKSFAESASKLLSSKPSITTSSTSSSERSDAPAPKPQPTTETSGNGRTAVKTDPETKNDDHDGFCGIGCSIM